MQITQLSIKGIVLISLDVHQDARGFFVERFQTERFAAFGLPTRFVQDNHTRSFPGVLRGLHYQVDPAQGKLIGVTRGRIWDVVVDIRPSSLTFGQHYGVELSDTNGRLLLISPGFAHGFCVLGDEPADVMYKIDARYNPEGERGLQWDDPDLAIPWPIQNPRMSARDERLSSFLEFQHCQAQYEFTNGNAQPVFEEMKGEKVLMNDNYF